MNRLGFAFVFVAAGLAWTAIDRSSVLAAGKELQGGTAPGQSDEGPAKRIDEAIQAYENRANQELEQTRSEIARLQKELGEMVELQFNLVVSVAELQAEMRVQQMAAESGANDEGQAPGTGSSAAKRDEERRRLRAIELNRELRGVLENLRNVVSQKRNETDQLVLQLRNLRAQQRQMAAAEAERKKQQPAPAPPAP
jgi:hypothetical protein